MLLALSLLCSVTTASAYVDYSKSQCKNGSCKCCGETDSRGTWWNTVDMKHCKGGCKNSKEKTVAKPQLTK